MANSHFVKVLHSLWYKTKVEPDEYLEQSNIFSMYYYKWDSYIWLISA